MTPYADLSEAALELLTRRAALIGAPNSGKTWSLRTWPRPICVVVFPGELGAASLPRHLAHEACTSDCPRFEYDVRAWGTVDMSKPTNWLEIVEQTRRLMADVLTCGKYRTVAGDGLHKLYYAYENMLSGGALARGDVVDYLKVSPRTRNTFFQDLRAWLQMPTPYQVWTMWVDKQKEGEFLDPAAPSHVFPALSGQAGRDIVGEFSFCLYAKVEGYDKAARYLWQTKPDSRVWGVGTKLPPELAVRLPGTVPQDWAALEKALIPEPPGAGPR